MIRRDFLREQMGLQQIACTEGMLGQFDRYAEMLVEWNEKVNLTAILEPDDIVMKHFVDSGLLLKAMEIPHGAALIDVGTGAGFPSIPLKLLRPDISITLLDSLQKRIVFLEAVVKELGIAACCIHGRAEEEGRKPEHRERYDLATARAVAHMRELNEYCLPFIKIGGVFAALKGYDIEQEVEEAAFAEKEMGGRQIEIKKFQLGDENRRSIVLVKKVRQTPPKYPRISAKIKKSPLIPH